MCKGVAPEESRALPGFAATCTEVMIPCELCGSRASLYCHADAAYLCRKCDRWVHEANFLARRHVRCFLCNTCQKPTKRCRVGISAEALLLRCHVAERGSCEDDSASPKMKKRRFLSL